ncbi:MAG: CotH kinase family protein [Defluviitaleaceae bacterium]|nr:CotH kinase family protein [Defluviitaleaceae bacterium]MCL2263006.1 CotH kinase family protein [Defluviitaleaceae bacterium]
MKNRLISLALVVVMVLGMATPVSSHTEERVAETKAEAAINAETAFATATPPALDGASAISVMSAGYELLVHGRTLPWMGIDIDLSEIASVNLNANTYTVVITGYVPNGSGGVVTVEEPLAGAPWANALPFSASANGENFIITIHNINETFFANMLHDNRLEDGNARRIRIRCNGGYPNVATEDFVLTEIAISTGGNEVWALTRDVLPVLGLGEVTPIWNIVGIDGLGVATTGPQYLGLTVRQQEPQNGYGSGPVPAPPVFSANAGFFSAPFNLTLTAEPNTVIRYTTDGSIPTSASPIFTDSIFIHSPAPTAENSPMSVRGVGNATIDWANGLPVISDYDYIPRLYYNGMVVRARAFNENGGSQTVTRSFFVERDGRGRFNTQVMSISVEPEHFAGETQGLYRNWYRDNWPQTPVNEQTRQVVHMEMFCPNGQLILAQNAMGWVYGNWSRGNPKRSMRFNFNQAGNDVRNTPALIPDTRRNFYAPTEVVGNFRHINARLSDGGSSEIRESLIQILSEPLRPTIQNSTYGAVFVNGEFWGMYCLRAHRHEHLIGEIYDVHRNSVYLTDNTWDFHALIDSYAPFYNHQNFLNLQNHIDMDNFIDYFIIGYHFENWDWVNNNFEMWRTTQYYPNVYGGDMRWRFVVHDFDNGINHPANDMMAFFTSRRGIDPPVPIAPWAGDQLRDAWAANTFINLFQNPTFRHTFAARYSTYTGTVFHPSRATAVIDRMVDERLDTIGADMYRWSSHGAYSPTSGINNWLYGMGWGYRSSIEGLRQVLTRRANYSISHIRNYFQATPPYINPDLQLPEDLINIRWQTDYTRGFFDIAGAQIRADLFDRGNLADYAFCVSDFNADYIRGLPIEFTARPFDGYVFSHFEINGENSYENPTTITPLAQTAQISITAVFEEEVLPEHTVLAEITRTENNAAAENNRFNATGGVFRHSAFLTAWSGNTQRTIGFMGDNRAPMVLNNSAVADGWRSVGDTGVTVDTATAFQIRFETTGHENIRFSARQRSTGSGPDYFALAYRVGSTGDFTSIPNTRNAVSLRNTQGFRNNNYSDFNWPHSQTFDGFLLPAAVANQPAVYLRVYMRETALAANDRTNGNTSINNIVITGEPTGEIAGPTFYIQNANARAGQTVDVNINIHNNPGFAAMFFTLDTPPQLTLLSEEPHEDLAAFFHREGNVMGWTGMTDATGNFTQNGTILTLTFAVDENAQPSFYPLTAIFANAREPEDPANYEGQSLPIAIRNGGVAVHPGDCTFCIGACTLGDINGDGRITSADATWLARYITGQPVQICMYAADFFGDGVLTPSHVVMLARALAGHNVTLDRRERGNS